jgi:hypothetical protein
MSPTASLSTLCLSLAFSLPAAAERTVTIEGGDGSGCPGVHMHFGDRVTARGEETIALSRRDAKGLVLEGSRNGGITVRGAEVGEFKITACTAAAGADDASARAVLSKVVLRSSGGRVTIEGPAGERWTGFLIVTAPRDADFSVEAANGPVSLTSLAGALSVKTANGPVSLSSLTGSVDVEVANGPISLKGSSGDVKIHAVNGPLTIALAGTRWEGKGLEASAKNGPLTLKVPDGFSSGVRVETSSHAPFSCRGAACESARRQDGNRTRLFEIGTDNATVRISTANGPVSIVSANHS